VETFMYAYHTHTHTYISIYLIFRGNIGAGSSVHTHTHTTHIYLSTLFSPVTSAPASRRMRRMPLLPWAAAMWRHEFPSCVRMCVFVSACARVYQSNHCIGVHTHTGIGVIHIHILHIYIHIICIYIHYI
jgi:hypothetical protein